MSPSVSLAVARPAAVAGRPLAHGKFLVAGEETLYVRGVTYGAFRPRADGEEHPEPAVVERDFAAMADNGINAVRTYTAPPRWLLDIAGRHGLRVMVGLAAELYVGYLADRANAPDVEAMVREKVRRCAGHPAILCYAIGNEIPAPVARWHGRRRIERFLERLGRAVKAEDPAALVTYVNYPSTEYLRLPFLDLVCFNVYLESRVALDAYLARLQNQIGDRPLLLAEIGLDSRRHGLAAQADSLAWQVETAFGAGAGGVFVYAWTDEWFTAGADVEDWDFGLTDRARRPKPALAAVRRAFANVPFPLDTPWPSFSVVVCSRNGARTIGDCLDGLSKLTYSDYEVIVVDDGSTDSTVAIARDYGVRIISTPNRGLSSARNTGLAAAGGEIVAYIDDDARPDPAWLSYLAVTYLTTEHAAVGGPNLPPPGDGAIAACVANAPGGPVHVLRTDRVADHLPGVNLSVRRSRLEAIGGFDPRFRAAGDDVDVCWRLQDQGWTLGFHPAAVVWHHRRNSVRTYWRQQVGYGRAEALLEGKWPARYNAAGHYAWSGRLYGRGLTAALTRPSRIYGGVWGSAPFQSLYEPAPGGLGSLPLMPEWYLVVAALGCIAALGLLWPPLLVTLPLLLAAVLVPVALAAASAARASFPTPWRPGSALEQRAVTMGLHLLQPLARLAGRLRHGLSPWRRRGLLPPAWPRPEAARQRGGRWQSQDDRLRSFRETLRASGAIVRTGGDFDPWDLEVRGGLLAVVRAVMAIEEHGGGQQLVRCRWWPRCSPPGLVLVMVLLVLAGAALRDGAPVAAGIIGAMSGVAVVRVVWEAAVATGLVRAAWRAESAPGGTG